MNKTQLMQILPHRDNMLLIDEASVVDGQAVGSYTVTGEEWFLKGHFPGNPVVPGVVLCEMMGQACCVLLADAAQSCTPYFTGLDKVKFRQVVRPGDKLEISCSLLKSRPPFYFAKGVGKVGGRLAVSGEFSFALKPAQGEG